MLGEGEAWNDESAASPKRINLGMVEFFCNKEELIFWEILAICYIQFQDY